MNNRTYKISINQERYYLAEKFTDANYNIPVSLIIEGKIDRKRLKDTLKAMMAKNDAFRISIFMNDENELCHRISDIYEPFIDEKTVTKDDDTLIDEIITDYFFQKTDFSSASLVQFQLIKITDEKHIFTLSLHHLLSDALSIKLLLKHFSAAWNDINEYQTRPTLSYAAFIEDNQLNKVAENNEPQKFWDKYLDGSQTVSLGQDLPEQENENYFKKNHIQFIEQPKKEALEKFAKSLGTSGFTIFYAAFNILFAKLTNSTDIPTSFQSHGRRGLKGANDIIGLFSRALILRSKIDDNMTATDLIKTTKMDIFKCIRNEQIAYHHLIKSSGTQPKIGINWYPTRELIHLDGVKLSYSEYYERQTDFDLNLHCIVDTDQIKLVFKYNFQKFSEERIACLTAQFLHVLSQIIENKDLKISDINLNTDYDKVLPSPSEVLRHKTGTLIFDDFIENARNFPEARAIHYERKYWTYKELDQMSDKIAFSLQEAGLSVGDKVALYATKSPGLIASILGTLKAGGAFVLLDSSYPEGRLKEFWEKVQPHFLINCANTKEGLKTLKQKLNDPSKYLEIEPDFSLKGEDIPALNQVKISSSDVAYYLFTSGTTGQPKSIATGHDPLVHFVNWQKEEFSLSRSDRFTMLSGVGHDPILRDIFTPLSIGGCILIPRDGIQLIPKLFGSWLSDIRATVCHITPQMSFIMASSLQNNAVLETVRYYFLGGDKLERDHAQELWKISPEASVVNFYGATETPQAAAYYEVKKEDQHYSIPIGKAIEDTQLLIVNKKGERVSIGEMGEIVIRSEYLSYGYVEEGIVKNKDQNTYATGDYGYYQLDGNTIICGRADDQIKIRGYRVELGDINHHLKSISGVKDALCLMAKDESDKITAYLVKQGDSSIDTPALNSAIKKIVPDYMVPHYYVWLDQMPLLPSGKIDRKNLPAPSLENKLTHDIAYVVARSDQEKLIVKQWEKILNVQRVSTEDTFTTLAGDSLSFVQTSLFLENILGHVPDNWNEMTIKELAQIEHEKSIFFDVSSTVIIRALSIFLIVAGHFTGGLGIGGATGVLLLVSGISFSDFTLKTIAYVKGIKPIINSLLRAVIPTTLYTAFLAVYLKQFQIESLLLYSSCGGRYMANGSAYWYIQVMVQIIIIFAIILYFSRARNFAVKKPYLFGIALTIIGVISATIIPLFWNTDDLFNRVPHMKIWYFSLGWCIFHSASIKQKMITVSIALAVPLITSGHIDLLLVSSTFLLLFVSKIKMITPLHKGIYLIAASSLFIYLTHFQFKALLNTHLGINGYASIEIFCALCGGIFIWYMWGKVVTVALHLLTICKERGFLTQKKD